MKALIEKIVATNDVELMDKFLKEAKVYLKMYDETTVLYVGDGMIKTEKGVEDLVLDMIVEIIVGELENTPVPVLSTPEQPNGVPVGSEEEDDDDDDDDEDTDKTSTPKSEAPEAGTPNTEESSKPAASKPLDFKS